MSDKKEIIGNIVEAVKKRIYHRHARKRVIVSDYNEYLKLYEQMKPAIRRIYREKKVPFPDDPYELFTHVGERQFMEGKHGSIEAELQRGDFEQASKMIEKDIREALNEKHEWELPQKIKDRIEEFSNYKQQSDLCHKVITALELLKLGDDLDMVNERLNKAAINRKIRGKLNISDDKKESVKNWTHNYISTYWD